MASMFPFYIREDDPPAKRQILRAAMKLFSERGFDATKSFDDKLEAYIGQVLALVDEHPDAMAFLSDSARVLWPKAAPAVRRQTMIGLARSLMSLAPRPARVRSAVHP